MAQVILNPLMLPGSPSAPEFGATPHPQGYLQPLVGPVNRIVAGLAEPSDPPVSLTDLPAGAARPEAAAIMLRRAGFELTWGEPLAVARTREVERFAFDRGRSSVFVARSNPDLISEMQIGSWFNAGSRRRLIRRLLIRAPRLGSLIRILGSGASVLQLDIDVWFWAGVRQEATRAEWHRLTRDSYVAFCYHQISSQRRDLHPDLHVETRQFRTHLRILRLLRYRPVTQDEVIDFHENPGGGIGRRRFLLTADDGYADALEALQRSRGAQPMAFVVTGFADRGERGPASAEFADWHRVREASQIGVTLGAHGRQHVSLVQCDDDRLRDELSGARPQFERAGLEAPRLLAYPYGHHNRTVRQAARAAGYRLAYTTAPGRNGAGTDRWCLRRISVGPEEGVVGFTWKALTGEPLPAFAQRWRDARTSSAAAAR